MSVSFSNKLFTDNTDDDECTDNKRMLENPTQNHIKILFNITLWISNLGQN